MKQLLKLLLLLVILPTEILSNPFDSNRYDQNDILLEEEDKRELFRGIKTVYAPEYRIYSNASISSLIGREKRELWRNYQPQIFLQRCNKRRKIITSSPLSEEDDLFIDTNGNNDIYNNLDGDNNLMSIPQSGKWNFSDYVDPDIRREHDLKLVTHNNATNISSLDLNDFWHTEKGTEEIRKIQGDVMKKYMNTAVDPCVDFYEFACGNWKHYHSIPPDRTTYDTFEIVRENLDKALRQLLDEVAESPPVKNIYFKTKSFIDTNFLPHDTSDATVKAKMFYKSCMQEELIVKKGITPLVDILNELGKWPIISNGWDSSTFDIIWLLARLRLLNNEVLIAQWVGPDMKNSNEYIVHIDQSSLGLPGREYYLQDSLKFLRAYKVFILTVVKLMGADSKQAEDDVEDLVNFEIHLAKIMASPEERRNISEIYLRTDLASLTLYFPQYDWKSYFDIVLGTNIDLQTPVACYCSRYLHDLVYLLSNTSPRTLQNYMIWRFVRHRTNNMDQRFMEAKQRFYLILFGREKQPPRWQFCVSQVNSNMGMAVGSLFVRRYFDQSSRRDTIEITRRLQEAFEITLLENTWLDNNTKEYAKMKLDYMDLKIGFPDFILNEEELNKKYHDVEVHPDYFFENVITLLRHVTKIEQKRMGTSVNRTLWSTPPAVVNAYYSRNKNQIMFPAGVLQPPFYNQHFPKALNFGGIGVVIGHEITHGFDDKGRLFDQEGNLHLWWRESSIEKFYEKSQCLIDQYGQYVLPDIRVALDGYLTQGENIADNGGLKQAFKAYETWLKENPDADETLPDVGLANTQLFFLNFAQVWCGQQRIEAAKSRIKTSVHAPGIFRVIGVLSNSEEFSRVYGCPLNSPMNPEFKCTIW